MMLAISSLDPLPFLNPDLTSGSLVHVQLKPKNLYHLHSQTSPGQSCYRGKKFLCLCMWGHLSRVQLFATLWAVAFQASLSGDFPGKNTEVYWPILVAIPF